MFALPLNQSTKKVVPLMLEKDRLALAKSHDDLLVFIVFDINPELNSNEMSPLLPVILLLAATSALVSPANV